MDTQVIDMGHSTYLVNSARIITKDDDPADIASVTLGEWSVEESNPFVMWIGGDFAEADNPNQNTQFWTAGDLELAEYTIKYSPLNMVHKFRQPIGFYAATKTIPLVQEAAADQGTLKIQALSGLWTHIFPLEAQQAQAADEAGMLYYSMECRGTHLTCGTDEAKGLAGCGETFEYMAVETHCEHLMERSSVRHIVNPTFRGGALIVPPVQPGWKNATAGVLSEEVMAEAAKYAEQNEAQYKVLEAASDDLTATAWEQMMGLILATRQG